MRYAQIDENGVCFADSYLSGEVNAENMILLEQSAMSPIGKKYVNGVWEELPEQYPPEQQTDSEIIMQSLSEIELQGLEAQQQRELLAQQMTDLELAILEGGTTNV